MAAVTVTKEQCIQALETEPIGAFDDFLDSPVYERSSDPLLDCKVCAAGAIFHAALGVTAARDFMKLAVKNCENSKVRSITYAETYAEALKAAVIELAAGEATPLEVLSSLYEWHAVWMYGQRNSKVGIENLRRRMVHFVDRYFPSQLKLELA